MTSPVQPKDKDFKSSATRKHISFFMSSLAGGGAERVVLSLADEFVKRGHRVDVLIATRRGELVSEIPKSVRVIELGPEQPGAVFRALLRLPFNTAASVIPTMITRRRKKIRSLPRLERYLLRQRPDVMLSTTDLPNLLALWAGWLAQANTRLFVKADVNLTTWVNKASDPLQRKLPKLISNWYPKAHGIVAVSEGLADELSKMTELSRQRISVIYNPVNCEQLNKLAAEDLEDEWFQPGRRPVILAAGRLHAQKDYPTLLRAFALLRKDRKARLAILGEGPERSRLKALAAQLGIAEDVRFLGFQKNPFAYMARAAVFVLSSAWEGLSNVLIEALACGCPVVSTDCPHGPAEVLERGKYGLLVPVGDHSTMAQALWRNLDQKADPETAKSRAGYFDIQAVSDRYLRLLFPK